MRIIKAGATSQSIYVEVLDSTSTTGGRKTGLAYNTASLTAYYVRHQGSATAITLGTLAAANSAYSSGGFKEVDATNMPGIYRLDVPDAAIAAGVPNVVVTLKGATGMVQVSAEIQLVAIDPQDTVRAGMTALPNAAAEAAGGLYTRGTGAGQINQPANGRIDTNVVAVAGTTQTARDLGAQLDAAVTTRLAPTVAGRTLDVSATGEAGVDWANVGSPTTVVGLTGTTVGTVTTTTTATNLTNERSKYMHGAVWIDTVNGAAGTVSYTNGVMTNPSASLTDAKTIADNLKLKRFWVQAGSTLSVGTAMANYAFDGIGYTLTSSGGTRDISGTTIRGSENLTGTWAAATQECYVWESQVGTSTWGEVDFHVCHIVGTISMAAAVPYLFDRCIGIAPNNPTLNFGSTADARSAIVSKIGGALTITNMRAGNILYLDGDADVTIDATCTAGTVYIAGNIRLTNNGSGQTVYDSSRWGEDQNVTNVTGNVTGSVGSVIAAVALTVAERNSTADALLDRTSGIETGWTPRQSLRVMLAALAGKLSGAATTTVAIRDVGDTKDRIVATVDASGNRSAVTTDAS